MDSITKPVRGPTLVAVDRIRKVYPKGSGEDLLVLDDVCLTLGKNEIVSFLGRSGCGKTTCCASSPA
jgi:NitT/TauT family transport system ATP-binding protein